MPATVATAAAATAVPAAAPAAAAGPRSWADVARRAAQGEPGAAVAAQKLPWREVGRRVASRLDCLSSDGEAPAAAAPGGPGAPAPAAIAAALAERAPWRRSPAAAAAPAPRSDGDCHSGSESEVSTSAAEEPMPEPAAEAPAAEWRAMGCRMASRLECLSSDSEVPVAEAIGAPAPAVQVEPAPVRVAAPPAEAASAPAVETADAAAAGEEQRAPLKPGARGTRQCLCRGEVLVMLGHYGWLRALGEVDHPDVGKNGGRVYLHRRDVADGLELVEGDQVVFYLYVDPQGLGAEGCRLARHGDTPGIRAPTWARGSAPAAVKQEVRPLMHVFNANAAEFVPGMNAGAAAFVPAAARQQRPLSVAMVPVSLCGEAAAAPARSGKLAAFNTAYFSDSDDSSDEDVLAANSDEGCDGDVESSGELTEDLPKTVLKELLVPAAAQARGPFKARRRTVSRGSSSTSVPSDSDADGGRSGRSVGKASSPPGLSLAPGTALPPGLSLPPGLTVPRGFLPPPPGLA